MDLIMSVFAKWLDSSLWTIVGICALVYILFTIRLSIRWFSIYKVSRLSDLPMEIRVPADVLVGIGLSVFTACTCISLALLLKDPTLSTGILALVIDVLLIFFSIMPLMTPIRAYKIYRREMEKSAERQK